MRIPILVALAVLLAGCTGQQGAVQEPPARPSVTPPAATPPAASTPPAAREPPPPPPEGSARQLNVTIEGYAFTPRDVVIAPGSTVTWTNLDEARHSVVLEDASRRAGPAGKGETMALTFPAKGDHAYACELHANMTGVVRVKDLEPPPPAPPPPPAHHNVTIAGRAFEPSVLRVGAGSTITWTNAAHEWHEAEADAGSWFSSGLLQPGQTFSIVAERAGTFTYRCDLHAMKGTLIVG